MKTVEINGREYKIAPPDPWVVPYLNLLDNLSKKVPKTVEEAEKDAELMKKTIKKLFEAYITPEPVPEDYRALLFEFSQYVIELSTKSITEAKKFR